MTPLPDRFDLWIAKARKTSSPARQLDYCLGTLYGQPQWFFVNSGSTSEPAPAAAPWDGGQYLLVFSSGEKLAEALPGEAREVQLAVPVKDAGPFCLQFEERGIDGILVNPGDYAFAVMLSTLREFDTAWRAAGGGKGQGFWIPNTTTEEDDFWDELGVD